MTVHELVAAARDRLCLAGIRADDAAFDAELLARQALGWDRAQYLCRRGEGAPPSFEATYGGLIARRGRREPVSLITGRREFWELDFVVTPDVLAPRPETELIVEEALALVDRLCAVQPLSPGGGDGSASAPSAGEGEKRALSIVDVGTGSGCLAIALARELSGARIAATDVSPAALAIAQRNAARLGVEGRITWHTTRFLEGLDHPVDLIVSNPPYVPDTDTLPPEVGRFEPPLALFAGPKGLDAIRELVRQSASHVTPGGALVFELGAGQAASVRELVGAQPGLVLDRIRDDLQGIPRVAIIRAPEAELNSEL